MVHKNKFVFPAEVMLRVMISYTFGITFAFFVNKDIPLVRNCFPKHSLFDKDLIFYIIYDGKKEVQEISANIPLHFQFSNNVFE